MSERKPVHRDWLISNDTCLTDWFPIILVWLVFSDACTSHKQIYMYLRMTLIHWHADTDTHLNLNSVQGPEILCILEWKKKGKERRNKCLRNVGFPSSSTQTLMHIQTNLARVLTPMILHIWELPQNAPHPPVKVENDPKIAFPTCSPPPPPPCPQKCSELFCFCVCQIQYWPASGQLDSLVVDLCAFPSVGPTSPTWLHLASSLSAQVTREAVTRLVTRAADQGLPTQQILSRCGHSIGALRVLVQCFFLVF